jgi:predicted nucleic acid-binding protein
VSIVVDASVALKWVFDEPGSAAAFALRGEQMMAPVFWLAEAGNALWRQTIAGQINAAEADERLSELMSAPVAPHPIGRHLSEALRLATVMRHPVYDCLYLALALHHRTHVVTADRRFIAAAQRAGLAPYVLALTP